MKPEVGGINWKDIKLSEMFQLLSSNKHSVTKKHAGQNMNAMETASILNKDMSTSLLPDNVRRNSVAFVSKTKR